jgi:hypothetical protein
MYVFATSKTMVNLFYMRSVFWMRFKTVCVVMFTTIALCAAGYGIYSATRSTLFLVQVVEVADQPENAPVDAQTISTLAAIPIGKVNLFELDLGVIEQRVLSNSWIREVNLQKRFPQTVVISVTFREPRALIQLDDGALSYVDRGGKIFGEAIAAEISDLPIFSGFGSESKQRIEKSLELLDAWGVAYLDKISQISSLTYDDERGYRAVVTYFFKDKSSKGALRNHAMVDLGQDFDGDLGAHLGRLHEVFRYLADHSIEARQIWADVGKKIVVKIARRS